MSEYKSQVFVITPFDGSHRQVVEALRNSLGDHYEFFTSEDLIGCRDIVHDIMRSICGADFIIADLTGNNSNVMYELGIAHTNNKKVVMITQDSRNDLPFDVQRYRTIKYSLLAGGLSELVQKVGVFLQHEQNNATLFNNPVSDYLATIPVERPVLQMPPIELQLTPSTPSLEADEDELLDYIADMEEDAENIQKWASELNDEAKKMGKEVSDCVEEIKRVSTTGGSGTASFVRKQAKKIAKAIKNMSNSLDERSEKVRTTWSKIEDNFRKVLNHPLVLEHVDKVEMWQVVLQNFSTINKQDFAPQLQEIRAELQQLMGFQKDLTRAARALDASLVGLSAVYGGMLESTTKIEEQARQVTQNT